MAGPTAPIADAIATYQRASLAVMNDPAIWGEESQRPGARLLAWPRPYDGTQWNRLLSVLFNADVDVVLALLRERDDPMSPAWPPDVHDPNMQAVLRVVQRGLDAGWAALQSEFGGLELNGRRDFKNLSAEQMAAYALAAKTGLTRDEAFAAVGLPRRRGFRAVKRAHSKK